MQRYAIKDLEKWKNSSNRKPLLLYGARQVGKTWLVRDFAKKYYDNLLELNFFENESLRHIFDTNIKPEFIIEQLELLFDTKIDPQRTLLFFDEIQESQRAMDALKIFYDRAPQYNIIAAGSFLGVVTARQPVGQTEHYTLYPMSFCEFLAAKGLDNLVDLIQNRKMDMITEPIRNLFETNLKQYLFVGGMPEAVQEYINTNDMNSARIVQNRLLKEYRGDFSKHIPKKDETRVRMLWDSIPLHLFKENKKFIYKNVKVGGRAAEFEISMQWLIDTGLVYKIYKTEHPTIPLSMHFIQDNFKLYMMDVGLFCAMADIKQSDLLLQGADIVNDMFGAISEQFVLQELKAAGVDKLYYWGRDGSGQAEVDFVIQMEKYGIVPIEVKSANNTKAKSLKKYISEYNPKYVVRTSLNQYRVNEPIYDIPLYMISQVLQIL
ncbi:MAG: AAA family ATPase [Alphaproteobacteria bacterium]|nr:AAA family ATPase [Alphaproteobacteria bacterium]